MLAETLYYLLLFLSMSSKVSILWCCQFNLLSVVTQNIM